MSEFRLPVQEGGTAAGDCSSWVKLAVGLSLAVAMVVVVVILWFCRGSKMRRRVTSLLARLPARTLDAALRLRHLQPLFRRLGIDIEHLNEFVGILDNFRHQQLAYSAFVYATSTGLPKVQCEELSHRLQTRVLVQTTPVLRVPTWDFGLHAENRTLFAKVATHRLGLPVASEAIVHSWRPMERVIERWADEEAERLVVEIAEGAPEGRP
jgi:hypothetical protein